MQSGPRMIVRILGLHEGGKKLGECVENGGVNQ